VEQKSQRAAAIAAAFVLAIAAMMLYVTVWPRLAPGTQCILVGDGVARQASNGRADNAPLGCRAIVIEDASDSVWNPARPVRARVEWDNFIADVERRTFAAARSGGPFPAQAQDGRAGAGAARDDPV
jgi:hypothetical protein